MTDLILPKRHTRMSLSKDEQEAAYSNNQRIMVTLGMLGVALSAHDHNWTLEERTAFDWCYRALEKSLEKLKP